ncbi:glucosaminidase domain-containing protein [Dictyobacter arantiisoli]|uniref:Mannosyl-glycoprotein endo-beta-N-acetylglucosamidase-like domain-containing protein n=1 Tax=Dictyobacter arantiisoli TaxID=2014874 RepID=A0A5A5TAH8_9CHLR|nr:glucosaminidase domain-containing protein [Dictyobacter arantiisoli]GCF07904.1 hypothetical protein KDI_14680 [Dictyobacter arantiisoli]
MPKVRKRTYRSKSTRRKKKIILPSLFHLLVGIGTGIIICISIGSVLLSTAKIQLSFVSPVPTSSTYVLQGPPTIDADFMNSVLEHYHSPAHGKGQALYSLGVKYKIDPAYALAFFMEESNLGTQGVAAVTHSLGNIRATSGYAQYNGYRKYASWEDGFEDWYKLISQQYINAWGLYTVDQIIPVYAPNQDNNNEKQYIAAVKTFVDHWRAGQIEIPYEEKGSNRL